MKSRSHFLVFFFLGLFSIGGLGSTFAQKGFAEGFFTSEANVVGTDNGILVSIKKYNPTQSEIEKAGQPAKNSPMGYLMIPFQAIEISLANKGFESKLYSLDKEGEIIWDITLGYSEKSTPSPIKVYDNHIYAGESFKDADKIKIQKIDLNGNIIWQAEFDSLNNVNDIYVEDDKVSALVSFDMSKKIKNGDGTFSINTYPVYFFMQLDILTGKRIVNEYQMMANYLSSLKFSDPLLNSDYSYFLNNRDSAIYLNVDKQERATVVSKDMSKKNSILKLAAGYESYHLLTKLSLSKNKTVYNLITDFYGKEKKYETQLPLEFDDLDRRFIFKIKGDSVATVVSNTKEISVVFTDMEGKSTLYKTINIVKSPVVAAGFISGKVFILQIENRINPGSIGKIKLDYY